MSLYEKPTVRVAILDMYEGFANQGMRCIREILNTFADANGLDVVVEEFDVRLKLAVPGTDFDIYISSGGPGSPLESEGSAWEAAYFSWLEKIERFNNNQGNVVKKHVFFICHSFQLICRHYELAEVSKRKSTSFGVFPIHKLGNAAGEPVFGALKEPFYAVDSRDYQVIKPDHNKLQRMGASILCIEKDRPHIPLERAIMCIRFNAYFFGTQFHPEADAVGMSMYLQTEEKKKTVVDTYGFEKWKSMVDNLNDPDKILFTHDQVLPNFLYQAVEHMQEALVV